mgnify:CR=1 FL=1
MAEITTLAEAIAELVGDGALVALEGFTHLIPFAAGHEIIRQGRRRLTLARMTPEVVEAKYGVPPGRYPEIAALVGETSDNLPGIPGVGPKTAAKWINTYDGLDNVIAHADEITGKKGEALREHLGDVIRNRHLPHDFLKLARGGQLSLHLGRQLALQVVLGHTDRVRHPVEVARQFRREGEIMLDRYVRHLKPGQAEVAAGRDERRWQATAHFLCVAGPAQHGEPVGPPQRPDDLRRPQQRPVLDPFGD